MTLGGRSFGAVLFDLDGTLVDSTPVVERNWRLWAQEYAVDPARLDGMHGVPALEFIAGLLPRSQVAEAFARIEQLEVDDTDGVVALPGGAEALSAVVAAGLPAAIVTSGTAALARTRLRVTGLPVPEVVVTADDITRGKPDPEPFRTAAERLGVEPSACLAVEDTVPGLRSARAAGVGATLAVTTSTGAAALAAYADLVVSSLADVRFAVESGRVRLSLAR